MYFYDFTCSSKNPFAGRKDGALGRLEYHVLGRRFNNTVVVHARSDQLITSSYFMGVFEDIIRSINVPYEQLRKQCTVVASPQTTEEFWRAAKRILR